MYTDTMSWWYQRSLGHVHQKKAKKLEPNCVVPHYNSVALIVGVTGISGSALAETLSFTDTPGGPWKVYGTSRRTCPEWLRTLNVDYIQCDIANAEETHSKLSHVARDITHIFYVSWAGTEDCEPNTRMLRNILDTIIPNASNLHHVAVQTGTKYYMGNMTQNTIFQPHDGPFHENLPRLGQDNFYYYLEDLAVQSASSTAHAAQTLTWSAHRPSLIFGFSPCSMMNIVSTLCAYAAICQHENKPLSYTGTETSWTCLWDAVDSDLLAEHFVWAATCPEGKNQAFNICNGDVFKWKHMWKVLADEFNVEAVGYQAGKAPVFLEEEMKGKEGVWDEIVKKHNLVPTRLGDVASFWTVDLAFRVEPAPNSMNKNKEFGFLGFRDSTKSFLSTIKKMRDYRFMP